MLSDKGVSDGFLLITGACDLFARTFWGSMAKCGWLGLETKDLERLENARCLILRDLY